MIRWGMIGCGDVAEVKSGPALYKASGSQLVAVMRRDVRLAEDFALRHGVHRWTGDAHEIIGASDIDAVYVATPPDTHRRYVLECAAAGKPVYVEKPMAMTAGECVEMVDACRQARVPLWVAYYRRALPRFLRIRDLIQEGAVGDVRFVVTRHHQPLPPGFVPHEPPWRYDAARGGGLFFEGAVHTLDLLDFLFGPIEDVAADVQGSSVFPAEDVVLAQYRFASGVRGFGSWYFSAPEHDEWNEVIGTAGRIRFSTFHATPIELTRGASTRSYPVADPPHVQQPLVQTIVDELRGNGRCPSTGESATRTATVVDRILGRNPRTSDVPGQ